LNALDRQRLDAALELAARAIGLSDPNPRVGCIIGMADGRILGQGFTQQVGGPHAEVMALRDAQSQGLDVRGATAWVTLEPCAHHGRTPPCCDALIAAGIARVVVAVQDPFPQVAGRGIERLRAAGLQVDLASADMAHAARELNIGFFSRIERRRPWVRLKVAASLDGRTALPSGASQWITGPEARADGHHWRNRASAILTGIGTILSDDPRMDVRLAQAAVQPRRVVLDSRLRMPPTARVLQPPGECEVITAEPASSAAAMELSARGVPVLHVDPDPHGRPDLHRVLALLATRGFNEIHVEAGSVLNGALLTAGLVDELLFYQAPILIGPGTGMATLPTLSVLADALQFEPIDTVRLGRDLRIRLRPVALDDPGAPA
jgi:diaminohydroxyphosphoribosylaminopyrimidine deaminase/5-amino-6-(5-phosphoribosylamino)uracil reductase